MLYYMVIDMFLVFGEDCSYDNILRNDSKK